MKLLNRRININQMKICSICNKISATDDDHLDCQQKRRIELEDEDLKQKMPEKLDMEKNANDLNVDIRAVLDHMTKEKEKNKNYLSCVVGLTRTSLTFMCSGDSTANKIAFAISSSTNDCIFLAFSTNPFNDSSVIVFVNSVATTPGSIQVTRIFFRRAKFLSKTFTKSSYCMFCCTINAS